MPALADVFRRASLSNDGDRPNLLANPEVLVYGDEWVRAGYTRAAEIEGRVIGFVTGLPNGDAVEVEDLFVDPDFMRRGVATALVDDVVEHATAAGIARVEVSANHHALAFYRSVGFRGDEWVPMRWGEALRMRIDING